jgi:hypothetical protein
MYSDILLFSLLTLLQLKAIRITMIVNITNAKYDNIIGSVAKISK